MNHSVRRNSNWVDRLHAKLSVAASSIGNWLCNGCDPRTNLAWGPAYHGSMLANTRRRSMSDISQERYFSYALDDKIFAFDDMHQTRTGYELLVFVCSGQQRKPLDLNGLPPCSDVGCDKRSDAREFTSCKKGLPWQEQPKGMAVLGTATRVAFAGSCKRRACPTSSLVWA